MYFRVGQFSFPPPPHRQYPLRYVQEKYYRCKYTYICIFIYIFKFYKQRNVSCYLYYCFGLEHRARILYYKIIISSPTTTPRLHTDRLLLQIYTRISCVNIHCKQILDDIKIIGLAKGFAVSIKTCKVFVEYKLPSESCGINPHR